LETYKQSGKWSYKMAVRVQSGSDTSCTDIQISMHVRDDANEVSLKPAGYYDILDKQYVIYF